MLAKVPARRMEHVLSPRGESALRSVLQHQPLLAFDFDGTLAPIVSRPEEAAMPAGVSLRLSRLARRLPVAIVTGRSVADVRERLGFEPHFVVGNHGAEGGDAEVEADMRSALDLLRRKLNDGAATLATAGVRVEDKGVSIALHYRLAPDVDAALATIDSLLTPLPAQLRRFEGKRVVNVMAATAPDKADAVRHLLRRSGRPCAVFAGDDVNDEPVFAAAGPDWLTVRVGRDDAGSRAAYFIDSQAEMALFLDRLAWHLDHPTPA